MNTDFGDGVWVDSDDLPAGDKSILMGIGPFNLAVGESQELIIAYVVGEGNDALDSVRKLKEQVQLVQYFADHNFDLTKLGTKDADSMPEEFILYQNYPNPFNPSTTISYNLPMSSDVDITIYDIVGNEVYSVNIEGRESGLNSFQWNSTDIEGEKVPTGIYITSVKAREYQKTIKMLLIQ